MHSLNNNGDSLAQEFARILGLDSKSKIEKSASLELKTAAAAEPQESLASDSSLEDEIADMIIEPSTGGASMASDSIDDEVSELDAYDHLGDKQAKIMTGLSKIASSLRAKSESFAADVVEATALSIMDDFKKEASAKAHIYNELKKMASDLDSKGDELSADMVRVTLSRIQNN